MVNFQMFKLDLEKAEEPQNKLPTSVRSLKEQENSRKTSTSALSTTQKPLTVWITTNCRKFLKRWEYQTTLPASSEICMQVKKQQLETDMEQRTGSKLGKEVVKAGILSSWLFNFCAKYIMWNAGLDEAQAGIKTAGKNINNLRYAEKEMATNSSVLAWRIPGTGEPGGLPSMGLHRVGHDWSDLAAAADMQMTPPLCQKMKRN